MLAQHPQRVLRVWSSVSVGWVGDHMILCAQPSLGMEIDLKSLSLMLHLPVPQGGQIPDLFCLTPHPRINSREMADLNVEGKIIKHIQVMQEVSPASSSTHGFPK